MTVNYQWELLTGDDVVHANKISIWKKQLLDVADTVLPETMSKKRWRKLGGFDYLAKIIEGKYYQMESK